MVGTNRNNIKPGLRVKIIQKHHQQTGQLTEGIVKDILTKAHIHHRGIKVRLVNGIIGRVQEIVRPVPTNNTSKQQGGQSMSQFENVTAVKAANIYFDGKVTSRTVLFPDGTKKTLGIMLPGEYEFGTAQAEVMEILAGNLDVLLPGNNEWQVIKGGESFDVPANSKFKLKVKEVTDYCCSYVG